MDHRLKYKMLNYKKKLGQNTGQNFDMCVGQESLDLTTKQIYKIFLKMAN